MLLDANWIAKLTDFGLAKQCVDQKRKSIIMSRTFCGTVPYGKQANSFAIKSAVEQSFVLLQRVRKFWNTKSTTPSRQTCLAWA